MKKLITDEEKKEGIWEYEGKKFKRCPNCDGAILAEWKSHGCGWGRTDEPKSQIEVKKLTKTTEELSLNSTAIVSDCVKEAIDILTNISTTKDIYFDWGHIIGLADQIRRTKLFLQLNK